jgi:hypothetical protein
MGEYNQQVFNFAAGMLGRRVGRGDCWDLPHQALTSAGAQSSDTTRAGADYRWGDPIALEQTRDQARGHHSAIVAAGGSTSIEVFEQNVRPRGRVVQRKPCETLEESKRLMLEHCMWGMGLADTEP